jgi:GNAT superfamily N-acetyltransferase
MNITYRKGTLKDVGILTELRIKMLNEEMLSEKNGVPLTENQTVLICKQVSNYFLRKLTNEVVVFVAETDGNIIATVTMLIAERPANAFYINGKFATVVNVYTEPPYRRQGIASNLLKMVVEEAKSLEINRIDLLAVNSAVPLYEKSGFMKKTDFLPEYTDMIYIYGK